MATAGTGEKHQWENQFSHYLACFPCHGSNSPQKHRRITMLSGSQVADLSHAPIIVS
jgi:cytochrome c553